MKIDQLIGLFGCEFREGRADSAPQLRREGLKVFDAADLDGIHNMTEATMHDPDVLPHMYTNDDIDAMFPNIIAAPLIGFGEDDPTGIETELMDPMPNPPGVRVHRPHRLRRPESFSADIIAMVVSYQATSPR